MTLAGCGGGTTPTPITESPALQCPANIAVANVTTPTYAVVYPKPTLTGGVAPIVSGCSPAQGFAFPVGTTTVSCTTTDAMNRQAACSFTVTITAPPPPPPKLGVTKVLAFGDSVTAGADGYPIAGFEFGFVNVAASYPTQLKALLDAAFPTENIAVINAGEPGEWAGCDTGGKCGITRLRQQLTLHRPEVLLLLDGYNDLLNTNRVSDGQPLQVPPINALISAMRDMTREGRTTGPKFVFLSTVTSGRAWDPGVGINNRQIIPQAITATNLGLAAVASGEGAHLVDNYAAFLGREQTLVNTDGLHLTAAGNRVLAETFYARMRQVILGVQAASAAPAGRR